MPVTTIPDKAPLLREFPRDLQCHFTKPEMVEIADRLAKTCQDLAAAEENRKQVASSLKSREDALKAELSRLSRNYNNGWEYRGVPCKSFGNEFQMIVTVRTDTGEVLEERSMNEAEVTEFRALELPFEDEAPVETTNDVDDDGA